MKISLIGSGNMGSLLAKHFAHIQGVSLVLCNRDRAKGEKIAQELGASSEGALEKAIEGADWILLAVKPKDLKDIAVKHLPLKQNQGIISILAGTSLDMLRKAFPGAHVVRMMPNLALSVQKGILGFAEDGTLEEKQKEDIQRLFRGLGLLLWLPESKMEAFASLAASSPAFVFVMMEAMIEAGIFLGFQAGEARKIVLAVFEGCVALLQDPSAQPVDLKLKIASPAGMTIAGLRKLEAGGIRAAIADALEAAYHRGKGLH